jgi:tetratricopeptide (TPR) repeat protein
MPRPRSTTLRLFVALAGAATVFAIAFPAGADDLDAYNRGLSAFNAGDSEIAAEIFFGLTEEGRDPDVRSRAQYYLGQSLARKGLYVSALVEYAAIVAAGKAHPLYLKAVEGLVDLQNRLNDQDLIPNLLNNYFSDDWKSLPPAAVARANYLVATIQVRRGNLERARRLLVSVPPDSDVYPKAQYLLGVVMIDPKFPGGPREAEALSAFESVLKLPAQGGSDLENTRQLALLAVGRLYYGQRQYAKAVEAYDRIPRFSRFWNQALFENGFARFQNDDPGGALGSLQALHAPQFAGAFEPESWILKSTIYYFNCLYDEARSSLKEFDRIYLPMAEAIRPLLGPNERDVRHFFRVVSDPAAGIPRPVLLWVRSSERMIAVFEVLAQIEKEKAAVKNESRWRTGRMGPELMAALDQNADTLRQVGGQLAKNRLVEAADNIKGFADQAEIIRFEITKAEKELAESGIDQKKLLAEQKLYRPAMPGENWNYWKFQGEFWIDEIGYYQYTLKRGCPGKTSD